VMPISYKENLYEVVVIRAATGSHIFKTKDGFQKFKAARLGVNDKSTQQNLSNQNHPLASSWIVRSWLQSARLQHSFYV
jgi:hypothetical protein